jgi:hypothetical protein
MDWRRFARGFTGLVTFCVGAAFVAPLAFHAQSLVGFTVAVAASCLFAALVAPNGYVFRVVRNVWLLAWIRSDRAARWTLAILGVVALAMVV